MKLNHGVRMKQLKINGYDNHKLILHCFDDVKKPQAIVLVIHDIKQTSKNFYSLAKFLNEHNFVVYLSDLRLHGKTAAENTILPIKTDYFKDIVNDHFIITKLIFERHKNLPLILLGHGFSSYLVTRMIEIDDNVNIAVLSGSGYNSSLTFKLIKPISNAIMLYKSQKNMEKSVEKLIYYGFERKFKNKNWLTTDEKVYEEYLKDETFLKVLPTNFYTSFLNNIVSNDKNLTNINKETKVLIISGCDDPVSNNCKNLNKLFNQYDLHGLKTTLQTFDGMRHNIFEETNKQRVFQYLVEYLNKNLK